MTCRTTVITAPHRLGGSHMRSTTVTLTAVLLGIAATACRTPPHFEPSTTIAASDSSDATSPSQSSMSVTQLRGHLLTKADLGDGYDLAPPRAAHHDDVTIQGCPALDQLGVDPPGSSLDFHRKVTASFTYGSAPPRRFPRSSTATGPQSSRPGPRRPSTPSSPAHSSRSSSAPVPSR